MKLSQQIIHFFLFFLAATYSLLTKFQVNERKVKGCIRVIASHLPLRSAVLNPWRFTGTTPEVTVEQTTPLHCLPSYMREKQIPFESQYYSLKKNKTFDMHNHT